MVETGTFVWTTVGQWVGTGPLGPDAFVVKGSDVRHRSSPTGPPPSTRCVPIPRGDLESDPAALCP